MNIEKSRLGNPKILSVRMFGGREAQQRSMLQLSPRELDWWALEQAKKLPVPMNARQYFNSTLADSLIVNNSITPTTVKTFLLTQAQAKQAFPLGFGLAAPFAGQVYRFTMGGLITTPATGTLIIEPVHGPGTNTTTGGTSMGASAAQTVTASLATKAWRLEGELIYRLISGAATSSTALLYCSFESQGTLATAGGGWGILQGSAAPVSVDTSGLGAADTFGALNFYVTFSVTGGVMTTEWSSMQSLN